MVLLSIKKSNAQLVTRHTFFSFYWGIKAVKGFSSSVVDERTVLSEKFYCNEQFRFNLRNSFGERTMFEIHR